ncbi:extracellular alkaline serine protease [Bacillus sp. NRRL B-14911]|uniref:S8 family serine peptidase n=1 Tax=Bacillus sp. NRRL B-14911 TaxID=313627 RepID=UPI00006B59CF|nr:S8 family serine peptidase [Bacillus sp. NRRL B-14911]EAR66244.1 extracellular alkaline serine protease [Bacillus sp. NRRL B-14911]
MKKITCIFSVLVMFLALMPTFSQVEATEQNEKDYLVEFNSEVDTQLLEKAGGKVKENYKKTKVAKAKLSEKELKKLKKDPKINLIEEDVQVESFPLSGNTFIEDGYSWGAKRVNVKALHENGERGQGIKVAILDTGISQNAQLTIQKEASFIDSEPSTEDENGHGTTVASLIASSYEKTGLKGIAPDVELYSAKVLNKDGIGKYSDIIEGLEWALENNVNIVNMSFGGTNNSKILENVINGANKAGVLLISSVGNNGEEAVTYPASYESVIGVGASNYYNKKTSFTNFGKGLELLAPGVNLSTVDQNGKLVTISGTSAASSYASGAAALIWSQNPHLDNEHIRSILKEYSTKSNNKAGYGLVNVNPNISQFVDIDEEILTNEEMLYLQEAGWSQEAISETPANILKEFINEGAMNPDYSESTYKFKLPEEENGDVQAQDLKSGGEITLRVSASYVGISNGYKQFKLTGSFDWNNMPINRYTDLFALAWTDNAWYNSATSLTHTWYGAIPITDYESVYKPDLKAGISWKVDLHAGSSDEKGSFTQYVYLPKSATSANGPFQAKVEYSHAFTTISPSIGGGSGGFTYGIVPGISTDYADNPPVASVKSF